MSSVCKMISKSALKQGIEKVLGEKKKDKLKLNIDALNAGCSFLVAV